MGRICQGKMLLSMVIYNIGSCILGFAQFILWKLNGIDNKRTKARTDDGYGESAQVFNVVHRFKTANLEYADPSNFLCTHEKFTHPDCVKHHNVSLYCLTDTEAVFVETPSEVDIYSSNTDAFFIVAQYKYAVRMITMPLKSFHKIADDIGPPKSKVIILSNTARCGSTLLTQMFEAVPDTISLSEPDGLTSLLTLKDKLHPDLHNRLIRDVLHVMCKPMSPPRKFVVIKPRSICFPQIQQIHNHFPDFVQLFLYRDCWKTIQSFYKMFISEGSFQVKTAWICQTNPILRQLFPDRAQLLPSVVMVNDFTKDKHPWMFEESYQLNMTWAQFLTFNWATLLALYVHFIECNIPITGIRYEDMRDNPNKFCSLLFDRCGIPLQFVEYACKAMEKDSQRGSDLSKPTLNAIKTLELTDSVHKDVDSVLSRLNLPLLGENGQFQGTLKV